jgi:hypothetical protein
MKKILIVILLAVMCSGCAAIAKQSLPTVLTSKEQMWIIPAGTPFKAVQSAKEPAKEFVEATSDLVVLYEGNLQELEQEANRQAITKARAAKKQGALLGGLGSILTILAGLLGKNFWEKFTKGNTGSTSKKK